MSHEKTDPTKPKKKRRPANRVRELLRARDLTNLPPRSCMNVLNIIAEHADHLTGRNAYPSISTLMRRTRDSERVVHYKVKLLRMGGWIEVQKEPDESAREKYEAIKARYRSTIHRLVFETFRGADSAPLTLQQRKPIRGADSAPLRGADFDTPGVLLAAPNRPCDSETTSPRTQRDETPEKQTPPDARDARGGGLDLSNLPAPGDGEAEDEVDRWPAPTREEVGRTVRVALKILNQSQALRTEYRWRAQAALTKLVEDGSTCLECALLVPYWVSQDEDVLKGLNQRTHLAHLWGVEFGHYMTVATEPMRSRDTPYDELPTLTDDLSHDYPTVLRIYEGRTEEELLAIVERCTWCRPRRRRAA